MLPLSEANPTGKEGDWATFIGQGVGTIKKDGAVSYRGAVYYQSSSPKWSRLNSVAAIFEHEVESTCRQMQCRMKRCGQLT